MKNYTVFAEFTNERFFDFDTFEEAKRKFTSLKSELTLHSGYSLELVKNSYPAKRVEKWANEDGKIINY